MAIHEFARIVSVVPGLLHPHGKIVLIVSLRHKLAISSCSRVRAMKAQKSARLGYLTPRSVYISHVGVVTSLTGEE